MWTNENKEIRYNRHNDKFEDQNLPLFVCNCLEKKISDPKARSCQNTKVSLSMPGTIS